MFLTALILTGARANTTDEPAADPRRFVDACRLAVQGDTSELPANTTTQQIADATYCAGYVEGVSAAVAASPPYRLGKIAICVPAGADPARVTRRVVANATDNPESLKEASGKRILVLIALAQLFPCPN